MNSTVRLSQFQQRSLPKSAITLSSLQTYNVITGCEQQGS